MDTQIDIDLALWSSASNENPVYYVQYAHARLSALARNAAELGLIGDTSNNLDLLTHEKEGTLIRNIGEFPRVLKTAASLREPHRVSRYLEDLAGDYHRFYDSCRVLPQGDEEPNQLHTARLALCRPPARSSRMASEFSASPPRSECERPPRRSPARRGNPPRRRPATSAAGEPAIVAGAERLAAQHCSR